jgi:hypothetical protein
VPKDFRDQFLKKLQICSNPLDFNDEKRQQKEKVIVKKKKLFKT